MVALKEFLRDERGEVLPFPDLGLKILQTFLTKSEREIEEFLTTEEEVKVFLIKCANLPHFRKTGEPITTIRGALLVLGDKTTRILTLGLIAQKLMKLTFNEFSYQRFWARALSNLITGYFLAELLENFPSHSPLSAYLLDFGILIMYQRNPEKYLEVLRRKQAGEPLIELEREVFGVTHPEVGAAYFGEYALPRRFVLNLRYHHEDPEEPLPTEIKGDLPLLRMIDEASGSFFGFDRELRWNNFSKIAKDYLTNEEIETVGEVLPTIINIYLEIFALEEYKVKPLKEWKEERERELKKLALKEESDLRGALKDLENKLLAILREKKNVEDRLYVLSKKLEETTIIDEWTQIYRPNYFLKRLKEEILRARRYGRSFAVLSLKIEGLISIRQRYGLSEGENFLRELVQELKNYLRRTDLLARAREEDKLWLILPETSSHGAMVVARKLLRRIEEKFYKKYQTKGSAFISVISYEPKNINYKTEPDEKRLVLLLDQGLVVLERKGQNRILLLRLEQDFES